ncbi:MAG: amidohydrolase family protein [Clostridiales Family XIII bacterium]|jgi:5-methylthioadenosine/S-adenosylhomocysteine deaminase|nr:amidohydrolase family protein [Clostridiales Family XIII bacterium]
MFDLIVDHAWILSSERGYEPYTGAVCVTGGRIEAVVDDEDPAGAPRAGFSASDAREYIDARGRILLPGLVNAHCHGDMAFAKGFGDGLTLKEQIEAFAGHSWFHAYITDEDRIASRAHTYLEALLSGTTCILENMYWSLGPRSAEIVRKAGIRAALCEDVRRDFTDPENLLPPEEMEAFARACEADGIVPVFAGVAEEDFSPGLLAKIAERFSALPVHTTSHVAETTWRVDNALRVMGERPVQTMDRYGLITERYIGSHAVWLDDEDIAALARRGASVASTPVCELKIGDGLAPVPKLLAAGVNVALGTDGAVWDNTNDLFRQMKCMAIAHNTPNAPRQISARQALDMATVGGARALGLAGEIGTIEAGKAADFILIDPGRPHMQPLRPGKGGNMASAVVYCATGRDVCDVFVRGRHLVQGGALDTPGGLDAAEVMEALRETAERVSKAVE